MARLVVPAELNRNHPSVAKEGPENTGRILIDLVVEKLGLDSLSNSDVLDVGCGVRLTQALVNSNIPIRSYTGIDVHRPLIDFLRQHVEDPRFSFAHWDVHNEMYNPMSPLKMDHATELPVSGTYDIIWLFSVFTHLEPRDAEAMLAILRRYISAEGSLFFTAFIGSRVNRFEDRDPERPLSLAFYSESYMRSLVTNTGWEVTALYPRDPSRFIQHHFICRPNLSDALPSGASGSDVR